MDWIGYIFRWIFWFIDNLLQIIIRFLYNIIFDIADARILQDYIWEFMGRIYTFLAIFMVFKLSISVVNYVLNPDQLTDKSKGFGKLIQNVIVVIGLIIMTPQIFDWAYKLQCLILNSGVINTIITATPNTMSSEQLTSACFGGEDQCIELDKSKEENAYLLTYSIFSGFLYDDSGGNENAISDPNPDKSAIPGVAYSKYNTCQDATYVSYEEANNCIFNLTTVYNKRNQYLFLISTVCLGFVAWIFLGFALDVAIRSVRLCVLQLIAPIPIISMLDPNSGKNGMFSKWLKDCTKTYGDLFIRLASIYFAMEIISKLLENNGVFGMVTSYSGCDVGFWAKLFIVLGTLAFAKQLPSFVESLTGIKMDGNMFDLKKKYGGVPGLGGAGTLGKKGIAGIDAMRNGKRFREGWNKIDSNGPISKFNKWKDGMMPYTADRNKLITEGKNEVYDMNKRWSDGVDIAKKMMNAGAGRAGTPNGWDKVLDGSAGNRRYYESIYKNKDFIDAMMSRDRADEDLKAMSNLYEEIQLNGVAAALTAHGGSVTIGSKTYNDTNIGDLAGDRRKQEKISKGANDNFESIKKQHSDDARTEAQYKTIKNNEYNPTDNTKTHTSQGIK